MSAPWIFALCVIGFELFVAALTIMGLRRDAKRLKREGHKP